MDDYDDDFYFADSEPEISDAEQFSIDCATNCVCGAWSWSPNNRPVHISDCICGAG